jgi:hypothetical protein
MAEDPRGVVLELEVILRRRSQLVTSAGTKSAPSSLPEHEILTYQMKIYALRQSPLRSTRGQSSH